MASLPSSTMRVSSLRSMEPISVVMTFVGSSEAALAEDAGVPPSSAGATGGFWPETVTRILSTSTKILCSTSSLHTKVTVPGSLEAEEGASLLVGESWAANFSTK